MSGHNVLETIYSVGDREQLKDPGASGTIRVNRSPAYMGLRSSTTESRTLPLPTIVGAQLLLACEVAGGTITVTVESAHNETGDTTLVFSEAGQWYKLESVKVTATVYAWRLISHYGVGNISPTESGALNGITASVDELNQAVGDGDEIVITTNVIAATENGKTFYLSLAAGFTSTLPAPALGLRFRFIVQIAPTGAPYIITTTSSANIMYGMMVERAGGAGVAGAARDTFNFIHTQSIIGDWVEFYSDGTNWYYHGMTDVSAGSTVAAT